MTLPSLPPSLNISSLNIDRQTLQAIEDILSYIESSITSNQLQVETFILSLKIKITELKEQRSESNSGMIHAGVSDLKQSFQKHLTAQQVLNNISNTSSYLLLFYAAECGLKSIYLKRKNLTSTAQIQNQMLLSKDGHNFEVWIKELRVPANIYSLANPRLPHFRLHRDSSSWDMGKAHQAWRYGVSMHSQDQQELVEWLEKLCTWVKENINR